MRITPILLIYLGSSILWAQCTETDSLLSARGSSHLEKGLVAYSEKSYKEAAQHMHVAAEQGNAMAMENLAVMYSMGLGVPQSEAEAGRWRNLASIASKQAASRRSAEEYKNGLDAEGLRDFTKAFACYFFAAQGGHPDAQFRVALMLHIGSGVPKNIQEAVRWYKRAADQGVVLAQVDLGTMYARGDDIPQDYKEAARWFGMAAAQGNADAQFGLAVAYRHGHGVPQNQAEATRLVGLAARQGHAKAQLILGAAYMDGLWGVVQNYVEAVRWLRLAADQGEQWAQFCLGKMYAAGAGVSQDFVQAHLWFNLAAAAGLEEARTEREAVARRMTAAQIAEAQRLARNWKPSKQPSKQ